MGKRGGTINVGPFTDMIMFMALLRLVYMILRV
jgi:hypothetical protein